MGGAQASLPLCQRWDLALRTSGAISATGQTSFPLPQIGTSSPCFLVADLGFPDCFASHFVVFVMKLAVEEWSPLHQCWHHVQRTSAVISVTAWARLPQNRLALQLLSWSSNLSFSDFSRATRLFWSSTWHGRMVPIPPTLAPRAENKWCHLCDSLGKTATKTDWHFNVFLVIEFECF